MNCEQMVTLHEDEGHQGTPNGCCWLPDFPAPGMQGKHRRGEADGRDREGHLDILGILLLQAEVEPQCVYEVVRHGT